MGYIKEIASLVIALMIFMGIFHALSLVFGDNNDSLYDKDDVKALVEEAKEDGYAKGLVDGRKEGYEDGFDDGCEAEQDDVWASGYDNGWSEGYDKGVKDTKKKMKKDR